MKINIVEKSESLEWPSARSGHCMCSDENYLYVFGGYDSKNNHAVYNELWRFNTSSNTWCKLPDPDHLAPKICLSSSIVKCKESLIIFGGTTHPFAEKNTSSISFYSLKSLKWQPNVENIIRDQRLLNGFHVNEIRVKKCGCLKQYDEKPRPKYGQSMVVSPNNDRLFIFGGTDGFEYNNELHSFCLQDLCWVNYQFCTEHLASVPCRKYRHDAIIWKNGFFVLGGDNEQIVQDFKEIEYFNFDLEHWEKRRCNSSVIENPVDEGGNESVDGNRGGNYGVKQALYPSARKNHTCSVYNGKVYMIGGCHENSSSKEIWILDLESMTWCGKKSFPLSVFFHTSSSTSFGYIYVFGGTDNNGDRLSDLYCISLNVSTLRRLGWLRCIELLKRNGKLSRETLSQLNIPKCFWDWTDDFSHVPGAC